MPEWKSIPGYEGSYEVSDDGQVRSLDRLRSDGIRVSGKMISQFKHPHGYWMVKLCAGNKKTFTVHHLMARAFLGLPESGQIACHQDDIPDHNVIQNLTWGTQLENMRTAAINGSFPSQAKENCLQGHLLAAPNLVPSALGKGHRACLACDRARVEYRYHKGARGTLEETMDRHYEKVMENA